MAIKLTKSTKFPKLGKTEYKYKGYHIFPIMILNSKKYKLVSYANDFKPKIFHTLKEAKLYINLYLEY